MDDMKYNLECAELCDRIAKAGFTYKETLFYKNRVNLTVGNFHANGDRLECWRWAVDELLGKG